MQKGDHLFCIRAETALVRHAGILQKMSSINLIQSGFQKNAIKKVDLIPRKKISNKGMQRSQREIGKWYTIALQCRKHLKKRTKLWNSNGWQFIQDYTTAFIDHGNFRKFGNSNQLINTHWGTLVRLDLASLKRTGV